MKFNTFALIGALVSCSVASPAAAADALEKRADGSTTILKSLSTIGSGVVKLDGLIKKDIFNGDLVTQLPVAQYTLVLIDTIKNQTAVVKKAGNIPLNCVLIVAAKAQSLIDHIAVTLADLSARKKFTDASSASGTVQALLQELLPVADGYINALAPKVPTQAKFLVTGDKRQIDLLLGNAIAFFGQPAANTTTT